MYLNKTYLVDDNSGYNCNFFRSRFVHILFQPWVRLNTLGAVSNRRNDGIINDAIFAALKRE